MADLLGTALEASRNLPPAVRDDIARIVIALSGGDGAVVELTPEEEAFLAPSLAQAEAGEFATEEEVRAVWARHGR